MFKTLLVLLAIVALTIAQEPAPSCPNGNSSAITPDLGRCTGGWGTKHSCCNKEQIDALVKQAQETKRCGAVPSEACFSQNVATLCLLACAPDLGASFIKDGKLQYCPGYANALFSSCGGDTLYCANNTAPCLLDPESTEGCRKVSEDATNAEEFVTKVLGGAYVASGENCFNSAGRVSVAIAAVFVAVVAFFGLM